MSEYLLRAGEWRRVTPATAGWQHLFFEVRRGAFSLRGDGVESVLVSETEIEDAFRWLYSRAKLACEPAAATALAPLLSGRIEPRSVAVVVSGGNVAAETAAAILARS